MEAGMGEKVYRLVQTRSRVLVNSVLVGRAKWKEKCGVAKVDLGCAVTTATPGFDVRPRWGQSQWCGLGIVNHNGADSGSES